MKRVLLGLILLSLSILLIACNGGYIVPVPLGGGWWSVTYRLPSKAPDEDADWESLEPSIFETNSTTEEEMECLKTTGNKFCQSPKATNKNDNNE